MQQGNASAWLWLARGIAFATVLAGGWLSVGAPHLTLLNSGLQVAYPWARGGGALLGAIGVVGLALTAQRLWFRAALAVLAVAAAGNGLYLLRYRLDTDGAGVTARGLWGTRRLAWSELTQVETGPGLVVLRAGPNALRLDVTDFRPEDRATLDRTIARRVRESSPAR